MKRALTEMARKAPDKTIGFADEYPAGVCVCVHSTGWPRIKSVLDESHLVKRR